MSEVLDWERFQLEYILLPGRPLATSGDFFFCQNQWVEARDDVKHLQRGQFPQQTYLAPNGNCAVAEKTCFLYIHSYNPPNNPTVIIFIISILQINKDNFSLHYYP